MAKQSAMRKPGERNAGSAGVKIILFVLVLISSLSMVLPFLWMVSASFKNNLEIFEFPISWIPKVWRVENYKYIWDVAQYPLLFGNTLIVTFMVTLLQLLTCSLSAYAFTKIEFKGRDKIFLIYLATLMVPFQVIMISQFMIVKGLHLNNTLWSLILTGAFNPLGVFMLRQFFRTIPEELSEAARIDGLSEFGIYSRIILPLAGGGLANLGIITAVAAWNDFLPPLIYLNDYDKFTIQMGMRTLTTEYSSEYGPIMAAAVISTIPILLVYLGFQRFFIGGVTAGAVKG